MAERKRRSPPNIRGTGAVNADKIDLQSLTIAIVTMVCSTFSLILSLVSSGASIANHHTKWDALDKLGRDDIERIVNLDAIFWTPGLYIICWLCFMDRSMIKKNVWVVLALSSFILFDCNDDVLSSEMIKGHEKLLQLIDIAVNALFIAAFWTFVRKWPVDLAPIDIKQADVWFRRFGWLRRYTIYSYDSIVGPVVITLIALSPKFAIFFFGGTMWGLDDVMSYAGMALIVFHLLLISSVSFTIANEFERRQVFWSLITMVIFMFYALSMAIVSVSFPGKTPMGYFNYVTLTIEYVSYILMLIALLLGCVFSNMISSTKILRQALALASVLFLFEGMIIGLLESGLKSIDEFYHLSFLLWILLFLIGYVAHRVINRLVKHIESLCE